MVGVVTEEVRNPCMDPLTSPEGRIEPGSLIYQVCTLTPGWKVIVLLPLCWEIGILREQLLDQAGDAEEHPSSLNLRIGLELQHDKHLSS